MLIEYTIRFDKSGVTVTQRVEPGPSTEAVAKHSSEAIRTLDVKLPDSFPQSASARAAALATTRSKASVGGASEDKKGTGGASEDKKGPGGGDEDKKGPGGSDEDKKGPGGSDEDKKGPGGGGPRSAFIVFGPIVMVGSGGVFGAGEGSGDEDKKGPG
jgi:hypothetical protein